MSSLHMLWRIGFSPSSMHAADTKETCSLSALGVGCAVMLRRKDLPAWGLGRWGSLSVNWRNDSLQHARRFVLWCPLLRWLGRRLLAMHHRSDMQREGLRQLGSRNSCL